MSCPAQKANCITAESVPSSKYRRAYAILGQCNTLLQAYQRTPHATEAGQAHLVHDPENVAPYPYDAETNDDDQLCHVASHQGVKACRLEPVVQRIACLLYTSPSPRD